MQQDSHHGLLARHALTRSRRSATVGLAAFPYKTQFMSVMRVRRRMRPGLGIGLGLWWLMLVAPMMLGAQRQIAQDRPVVYAADVDALIHPVSAEYISQTIDRADSEGADLVVFTIRTPGGLVDSTRAINARIIEAETPVVIYVGPSGARAASAGFLITIAADVAAMAPGTHIGAAHPVSGSGVPMDETAAEKAASDVAAYARSLASRRQRNVELAEKAVTESLSFTEEEALAAEPPLIDLIATDFDDLLEQLHGRRIRRWDGRSTVLRTAGASVERIEMSWRQRVLSTVAHPQVAVLLFSLGSLGLTIELWNPGAIVPGIVGGVCLLLAFFAFQILPINYVGLLLILFGLILLVIEMLTPTYGLLATGGIVSMVFGGVMLVDSPAPELQLGWPFILSTMLALGLITGGLVRLGVRAQRTPPVTGTAGMVEQVGRALSAIPAGGAGRVTTRGEIWSATSDEGIAEDAEVRVIGVKGMTLTVRRGSPSSQEGSET